MSAPAVSAPAVTATRPEVARRSDPAPARPAARDVARSKVMAIRFVAQLGALGAERRAALVARLRAAQLTEPGVTARAHVHAAADPDAPGCDVEVRPFLTALAALTRDALGSDSTLVSGADDVVRALLVHTHPAYRADFHRLYAPFAADIGIDRLLLG